MAIETDEDVKNTPKKTRTIKLVKAEVVAQLRAQLADIKDARQKLSEELAETELERLVLEGELTEAKAKIAVLESEQRKYWDGMTRKEFLALPVETRRRILARQVDDLLDAQAMQDRGMCE
mgnify:CR=1 FL=1